MAEETIVSEEVDVVKDDVDCGNYSQNNIYLVSGKIPSVWVPVYINGVAVKMELDTGASISLENDHTWRNQLQQIPLKRSHVTHTAYSGHRLPVLGEATVTVQTNGQKKVSSLVVVEGKGPPLLGRNWLAVVVLD